MVGTIDALDTDFVERGMAEAPFVDDAVDFASPTVPVDKHSGLTLKHVLFFHRHGDRTPVNFGLGTKWKMDDREYAFWKSRCASEESLKHLDRIAQVVGPDPTKPRIMVPPPPAEQAALGQLTQVGVDDMRAKGADLRKRYASFFKANGLLRDPYDKVYVKSSFLDRTIQSTESLLDGMFSDNEDKAQEPQATDSDTDFLRKNVFLIRTQPTNPLAPKHEDDLFNRMEIFLKDEMDTLDPDRKEMINSLRRELREVVGIPEPVPFPWSGLRDVLTCRDAHGLPYPDGITNEIFAKIHEIDRWLWFFLYNRNDVCSNAFREGVREVYDHLHYVVAPRDGTDLDKRGEPKISIFSAHDNSIVALLCALHIMNGQQLPVYGTIVTIEVYEDAYTEDSFLRVLFDGRPVPFEGHEHDVFVPFSFFEERAKSFLDQ